MDGIVRLNELLAKFSFSSETDILNNQWRSVPLPPNSQTFQVGEFLQLHNMPISNAKQVASAHIVKQQPSHKANKESVKEDVTDVIKLAATDDLNDELDNVPSTSTSAHFSQRRCNPMRTVKENSALKIKQRSILKPARRLSTRPEDIKKLYTQQKLGSFRPSSLETIFEEPQGDGPSRFIDTNQVKLVGIKKIRRSLSCSDGIHSNKTLVKRRRNKVKKLFGKRLNGLNKWTLNDLMTRLCRESNVDECDETIVNEYDNYLSGEDAISTDTISMDALSTLTVVGDAMDQDRMLSADFDTVSMISFRECSAPSEDNERNAERASRLAKGLAIQEDCRSLNDNTH